MYIRTKEPGTDPVIISTWDNIGINWRAQLASNHYKVHTSNTVIIDEAQLTYWDTELWNSYLKTIGRGSLDRVILFASYANPIGRVAVKGTSMVVPPCQAISLRPVDHLDQLPSAGLFLSADEFAGMVKAAFQDGRFTADFLDSVFHLTAGHAGAVKDMLRIVMNHAVSLFIKPQYSLTIVSSHTVNSRRIPGTPWISFRAAFLYMS
jgi:hypothetical protein